MTIRKNLAFVFPGQGSQSLGMISDLAVSYPDVIDTFAEASDVLKYDLWSLVQNGPEDELNRTEKTQPAMLTAGVAIWRVWKNKSDVQPAMAAGHSLGEYTALVCAGSIRFPDAVALVADRGRFMQEAVPDGTGAMAAILGLDDVEIIRLCNEVSDTSDGIVSAANFNSPGQVVVAGHYQSVEKIVTLSRDAGAKRSVTLPVSVPSHCALMTEAAQRFSARLNTIPFADASIPVIQNVDACSHIHARDIIPNLVSQLSKPVLWTDTIQFMIEQGIDLIIECGPGRVLNGLNKRIDRGLKTISVNDNSSLDEAIVSLST